MSETAAVGAPAGAPEAPAAPAGGAPAPATGTPAPAAPAAPITEPDDYSDLAGLDPKWAKEVRDLRKEAAGRRVSLKPYEEAFQAYSPQERDVWLGLAQLTAVDPAAGAKAFRDLAAALEEGATPAEAAKEAGIPPADGAEKPLTKAELDKYWSEKQNELQVNQAAAEIEAKARAAGYEPGSKAYKLLLTRALELNYDLDAAIKEEQAEIQTKAEALIADKIAKGEKWPITPSGTGSGAPSGEVTDGAKTFPEARERLMARLKATVGK